MNGKTALIELLLAGFFAVACIRARVPAGSQPENRKFADFFRLSGRVERLRRSRWQWFAMVALMLVLRLQQQLPPAVELLAAVEFALFLALPGPGGHRTGRTRDKAPKTFCLMKQAR